MWLNGLIIITILSTSKSSDAEMNVEAAFQGHCGHASPCEQLCYEIHDGMYECECIEGYELDKNGYSCQVMNTTDTTDNQIKSDEDVLYQRGASFSAKLSNEFDEKKEIFFLNKLFRENIDNNFSARNILVNQITPTAIQNKNKTDVLFPGTQLEKYFVPDSILVKSVLKKSTQSSNSVPTDRSKNFQMNTIVTNNGLTNDLNIPWSEKIEKEYNSGEQLNKIEKSNYTESITSPLQSTNGFESRADSFNQMNLEPTNIKNHKSNQCELGCGAQGECVKGDDGFSKCLCPFGKNGSGCIQESKISVPRFSKKSWLAFPPLRGAYKHVQIRIEFLPENLNGIIVLTGERDDLTGDFMALLIYKGFVEFWFDCGSGSGNVRSRETVILNQWNSVAVYRHRWDAWLVLNQGKKVQGRSKGLFSRITFREPLFLGGKGNITGLANRLPINNGFMGCIKRFATNEHEYKFDEHPLGDIVKGFYIQDCVMDKCFKYSCQHGGKCLLAENKAVCLCPIGFTGDLCETRLELQVPFFNGSSYLRYTPIKNRALIWLELQIILKPLNENGIILFTGHPHQGDFIALTLNNGYIEFHFDLGSGSALVRSYLPISIDRWHTIKISRTARLAVLKVDKMSEMMTVSSNGFWHLSLPYSLYLGGVHHFDVLPESIKNKSFFVGCIQKVKINGQSLSIISEALGGKNVDNCPHACSARPCGPLAQCVPILENYTCRCNFFSIYCKHIQGNKIIVVGETKTSSNIIKRISKKTKTRQNYTKNNKLLMHQRNISNNKANTYLKSNNLVDKVNLVTKDMKQHNFFLKGDNSSENLSLKNFHGITKNMQISDENRKVDQEHREKYRKKAFEKREMFQSVPPISYPNNPSIDSPKNKMDFYSANNDIKRHTINKQRNSYQRHINTSSDIEKSSAHINLLKHYKNSSDKYEKIQKDVGACFTGVDSYFRYSDAETMKQVVSHDVDLNLRMKTLSKNAIILWTGTQNILKSDDYLYLGIENGFLHLRYNLDFGEADIFINNTEISDGLWHRVRAIRNSQESFLEVDGRKSIAKHSPGRLRQLNTDTGLYVGGVPKISYLTRQNYIPGINGCISEIILAGVNKLNFDPTSLITAKNVQIGLL